MIKGRNIALPLEFTARKTPTGTTAAAAGALLKFGTSTTPLVNDTAGACFINGNFDVGATSGDCKGLSITLAPTGVLQTYSTAVYGQCAPSVQVRNPVGVQGDLIFGAAGWIQGLGYAIGGYLGLPAAAVAATGNVACISSDINCPASNDVSAATRVSCVRVGVGGNATAKGIFETKATFFSFVGFTATAGTTKMLSSTVPGALSGLGAVQGIRVGTGTGGGGDTMYYIPLIPAAAWTALGSATLLTDDTAGATFLNYSFDCGATSGDNKGLSVAYAATGTLQTYSTAIYGGMNVTAQARNPVAVQGDLSFTTPAFIQGLGYGVGTYITLPAGAVTTGTFACMNSEINAPTSYSGGASPVMSVWRFAIGGNATAVGNVEDYIALLDVQGVTEGTGNVFSAGADVAAAATLRVRVNTTYYYMLLGAGEST